MGRPGEPGEEEERVTGRQIMTDDEVRRALVRISHEIVEKHGGTDGLALVGILRRGVPIAQRLRDLIEAQEGVRLPVGTLDITFHRDDQSPVSPGPEVRRTDLPFALESTTLVVVDDVLYTGRTVRAAMDALIEHGRPAAVRLAVLVDRGHRELPIRADHVGKNVPTSREEVIRVHLRETDGVDEVVIERRVAVAARDAGVPVRSGER
jgi:pyrimidine operon attenuation protein/uracil phosphoribosyltransferase